MIWAFWGTDEFSVVVLDTLKDRGLLPTLIITTPDKPKGRKLIITPPPVKIWAQENKIDFIQPDSLKFVSEKLKAKNYDLFLVASYGKIISQTILDLPAHGTLNIHPSLLPRYRGSTPIESAILNGDKEAGVTIMLLDKEMDHGPIIAQEKIDLTGEETAPILAKVLAQKGANLFADVLAEWLAQKITPLEQDHDLATYTQKIEKKYGEINLNDPAILNFRRFRAYQPWPGVYTEIDNHQKKIRLTIKKARLDGELFVIERVTPEGKKEMSWEEFQRGIR
ncbi:MAG: methionyl-tRNA formyltransferase [Candidatus Paceibacterota bacterium]|jgi:methionyl-tRNA formyltransferase